MACLAHNNAFFAIDCVASEDAGMEQGWSQRRPKLEPKAAGGQQLTPRKRHRCDGQWQPVLRGFV